MLVMAMPGHNSEYGVPEDGRDDKRGTTKAPSKSITDYGMNSYSIGIEIVHVGGQGAYPEAQLEAIDGLLPISMHITTAKAPSLTIKCGVLATLTPRLNSQRI